MSTMNKILAHGLAAGLLAGLPLFAVTVALQGHPPSAWGAVFGYLTMLVALSAVFVAIKRRRDVDLGGVIGFWPGFGLGLAISLVAGVIYVLCWEAALAYTGMDFAGEYARALIAQQQAKGVSGPELAAFTAEMEKFKAQYANPVYRGLMTFAEIFPVGLLVSAVAAGLLRNSRFLPARRP
jgi:Protein of unknown function (DUF4199)